MKIDFNESQELLENNAEFFNTTTKGFPFVCCIEETSRILKMRNSVQPSFLSAYFSGRVYVRWIKHIEKKSIIGLPMEVGDELGTWCINWFERVGSRLSIVNGKYREDSSTLDLIY